ncbi:MAG: DUF421 domain-containing protein [Clostridia bacterium]|nr:DUF421 domain-containing protein [Clostridia bacterium]
MINLVLRCTIIYFVVIIMVRLMGKRQIGELQPSELVITILISDVASMPLQNMEMPLISTVTSLLVLVMFEVLLSIISIKSRRVRKLLQGNSVMIIKDGKLIESRLKLIRYSVDDLMEALRLKDVFDISQVQYAYIETNGAISVELKPLYRTITPEDLSIVTERASIPCLVICDGEIVDNEFDVCNMTKEKLQKILDEKELAAREILLMTIDSTGRSYIKLKEEKGS